MWIGYGGPTALLSFRGTQLAVVVSVGPRYLKVRKYGRRSGSWTLPRRVSVQQVLGRPPAARRPWVSRALFLLENGGTPVPADSVFEDD